MFESQLARKTRPDLETHMKVGVDEWYVTGGKLADISPDWSKVFISLLSILKYLWILQYP